MENTFKVIDNGNGGTVEIVEESELFYKAEYYAERLNDECFEDEDEYIVTDLESAIDVLDTATIYVEKVE